MKATKAPLRVLLLEGDHVDCHARLAQLTPSQRIDLHYVWYDDVEWQWDGKIYDHMWKVETGKKFFLVNPFGRNKGKKHAYLEIDVETPGLRVVGYLN